jgi:AraC-like DNA-binding protein
MFLIRSGVLEGFERQVRQYNENGIKLIRDAGLIPSQLRNPNTYISYSKVAELLEIAATACKEPFFGLLLAPQHDMGVFRDLVSTVCQEPSVTEAIAMMDRLLYLHASGIHITQKQYGKNIHISINFDFDTPLGTDQLNQFSVGRMIKLVETLIGGDPFRFGIHFQQPRPAPSNAADEARFSEIAFSSTFNGMEIPREVLAQKPNVDQVALQQHFDEYLRQLKSRHPDNLQGQVKELIGRALPSGDCSIETVAANLDMHPRALQRKLKAERSNYASLLQETRQTVAEQYLMRGGISITDLALNLGYAEVAVFSRHFKKWTGRNPTEWRKRQRFPYRPPA